MNNEDYTEKMMNFKEENKGKSKEKSVNSEEKTINSEEISMKFNEEILNEEIPMKFNEENTGKSRNYKEKPMKNTIDSSSTSTFLINSSNLPIKTANLPIKFSKFTEKHEENTVKKPNLRKKICLKLARILQNVYLLTKENSQKTSLSMENKVRSEFPLMDSMYKSYIKSIFHVLKVNLRIFLHFLKKISYFRTNYWDARK